MAKAGHRPRSRVVGVVETSHPGRTERAWKGGSFPIRRTGRGMLDRPAGRAAPGSATSKLQRRRRAEQVLGGSQEAGEAAQPAYPCEPFAYVSPVDRVVAAVRAQNYEVIERAKRKAQQPVT